MSKITRRRILRNNLLDQSVIRLSGNRLIVHRTVVETYALEAPTDAWIKSHLSDLQAWCRPADNFGHVVCELRKGRTYILRNGFKDGCHFADYDPEKSYDATNEKGN